MRFPMDSILIVIDASFISLRTMLKRAVAYLRDGGAIVALVKPQFEAGRERVGGGGVVRDPATHRAVLAGGAPGGSAAGTGGGGLDRVPIARPGGKP